MAPGCIALPTIPLLPLPTLACMAVLLAHYLGHICMGLSKCPFLLPLPLLTFSCSNSHCASPMHFYISPLPCPYQSALMLHSLLVLMAMAMPLLPLHNVISPATRTPPSLLLTLPMSTTIWSPHSDKPLFITIASCLLIFCGLSSLGECPYFLPLLLSDILWLKSLLCMTVDHGVKVPRP